MRQIGTLPTEEQARRFDDYLLTLEISSRVESEEGQWTLWIIDEDEIEQAKQELAKFVENPDDPRYTGAADEASRRRRAEEKKEEKARKNFVDVRRRWQRPLVKRCPVVFSMIAISVVVGLGSQMGAKLDPIITYLSFTSFDIFEGFGIDGIKKGEIWRLVTPMFIHFGILHLVFNMMWLKDLGSMIESRNGSIRFAVFVLVTSILSNSAQYYSYILNGEPIGLFGGMSGVVFGLFGYVWMKSRYDPQGGWYMHSNTVVLMIGWFFLCMTGWVGNIANTAHGVGLAVGIIAGYAPVLWRNQRLGH